MLLPGIILLGVLVGMAVGFREWHEFRKGNVKETKRLVLDVPVATYAAMEAWAARLSVGVKDYANMTLAASIPPEAAAAVAATENVPGAVDAAFAALDDEDAMAGDAGMPGILPVPPQPAARMREPQPGVVAEADRTHPRQRVVREQHMKLPKVPPGPHPCVHLKQPPPAYLANAAQGTCGHRAQPHKPCFFAPTAAHSCPLSETRSQFSK